jgi:hypothetical protein
MYRSLLAAALVPLALGDYSYDYNVPTMAPTTETAQPTLEVCPQLAGLTEEDCPGGEINDTLAACNSTGLVLGQFCWAIVDGTPGVMATCGDEPDTDCAYTGPPFDTTARRRLSVVSSGPGVFAANGTNPTAAPTVTDAPTTTNAPTRTETYAPTRMTEAPSYAPTTDTYAPTMAPTTTEAPTGMPTANMTNTTVRRRALLEKGSSFIDESVWFQRALAADKSGVVQSLRDIWGY